MSCNFLSPWQHQNCDSGWTGYFPPGCGEPERRSADKQTRQDVHDAREGPPAGGRHGQSHRRVQEGSGVSIVQGEVGEADKWTSHLATVQSRSRITLLVCKDVTWLHEVMIGGSSATAGHYYGVLAAPLNPLLAAWNLPLVAFPSLASRVGGQLQVSFHRGLSPSYCRSGEICWFSLWFWTLWDAIGSISALYKWKICLFQLLYWSENDTRWEDRWDGIFFLNRRTIIHLRGYKTQANEIQLNCSSHKWTRQISTRVLWPVNRGWGDAHLKDSCKDCCNSAAPQWLQLMMLVCFWHLAPRPYMEMWHM